VTQPIVLQPCPMSVRVLEQLERIGRVRVWRASERVHGAQGERNYDETIYTSDPQFGSHKLICAALLRPHIALVWHPDDEDIYLPDVRDARSSYWVACHLDKDEARERAAASKLAATDFTCIRLFPAPRGAEIFTVRAGTLHCEVTPPGVGSMPHVFVTEPSSLPQYDFPMAGLNLQVAGHV
jgi:hypothetical protein